MPRELPQHRVLRVFIGSPGDLQDERTIAREVVQRVNKRIGRYLGVYVDLRGWEDTLPGYTTRPQEKINKDLRECDVFLGLIWKRWGTPPSDDGPYTSGFQEEYHLALEQREADEMRDIFLYFKEMPDALREDPGAQASKVLDFRRSVEQNRTVLFDTFEDKEEWKEVLRDLLDEYLTKNFIPVGGRAERGQPTRGTQDEQETDAIEVSASLEALLRRMHDSNAEQVSHLQIARTNLYTTSLLYQNVHRDHLLDTDEMHYLYTHRGQIKLEKPEGWLVLRTLLGDHRDLTVGWYWINLVKDRLPELMVHLATRDELESIRMQALRLLQAVSADNYRETVYRILKEGEDAQKVKVLNHFAPSARETDLEVLRQIVTEEEGDVAEAAWRGIVVALAYHDPNAAIDWILETPRRQRGHFRDVLDRILEAADSDHVRKLLTVEDETARFKAMETVKDMIGEEELRELTEDDNPDIAAASFLELIARGREVDEREIEQYLDPNRENVQSRSTSSLGHLLASYPKRSKTYKYEDVLFELYKTWDEDELREGIMWVSTKSPIRYAALADRNYEEFEDMLKEDVESGFERIENREISQLREAHHPAAEDLIEKLLEYNDFTKGSFYRAAFGVLARHATAEDIEIARSFIRDPHQSLYKDRTLSHALDIVNQFGTKEDTELLDPFLTAPSQELRVKAAKILFELDPERRQEYGLRLLKRDDWDLRKIALRYSLNEEEILPTDSVGDLLYDADENSRLGSLAYLAQNIKESELKKLLEDYTKADDFDFYYYDVICWLDRLTHAPEPIKEWFRDELTERLEESEPIFELL